MAADVKFNSTEVKTKLSSLEAKFSLFSDTLSEINNYIQTKVNVGVDSAVFGNYGSKMLSIWDQNASTFGDFHANFQTWSEAVSIIAAAKGDFALDVTAMYRDNGGTLDGVKSAREYLKNGSSGEISADGIEVLDLASKVVSQKVTSNKNEYGGKTISYQDSRGKDIVLYYDSDGNLVAREETKNGNTTIYDYNGKKVKSRQSNSEYVAAKKAAREKEEKEQLNIITEILEELKEPEGIDSIEVHSRIPIDERNARIAKLQAGGIKTITVPIWDGKKETTMQLTIASAVEDNYRGIFEELTKMKFPVKASETGAYVVKYMDSGRMSDHGYGGTIDINWGDNPYNAKPANNQYGVTEDVVKVFAKYGFYWGSDWESSPEDPMHFSYTGW